MYKIKSTSSVRFTISKRKFALRSQLASVTNIVILTTIIKGYCLFIISSLSADKCPILMCHISGMQFRMVVFKQHERLFCRHIAYNPTSTIPIPSLVFIP